MDYGIQMFSVRDYLGEFGMEATLKALAEIGYKYIEFFTFDDEPAEKIKEWLDKYGLYCSSAHCHADSLIEDFEETVAYHKTLGNKHYIIPFGDLETAEDIDNFVKFCKEYGPRLEAEGITLHYHNHDFEFRVHDDGQMPYAVLEHLTDIKFETDTYWLYVAKTNPTVVMNRLRDRIQFIHVKDGSLEGTPAPLGHGTAPVADVVAMAKEYGFTMIVESETCEPSGMDEAKICYDYLKSLE